MSSPLIAIDVFEGLEVQYYHKHSKKIIHNPRGPSKLSSVCRQVFTILLYVDTSSVVVSESFGIGHTVLALINILDG